MASSGHAQWRAVRFLPASLPAPAGVQSGSSCKLSAGGPGRRLEIPVALAAAPPTRRLVPVPGSTLPPPQLVTHWSPVALDPLSPHPQNPPGPQGTGAWHAQPGAPLPFRRRSRRPAEHPPAQGRARVPGSSGPSMMSFLAFPSLTTSPPSPAGLAPSLPLMHLLRQP